MLIDKADQILSMISVGQGLPREQFSSATMLGPYLEGLKDDAETILDSIDYQQEDEQRTLGQDDFESDVQWRTTPSAEVMSVTFTNSQGRCFCIPFEACKTWAVSCKMPHVKQHSRYPRIDTNIRQQMSNIIQGSFSNTDHTEILEKRKYDLIADGTIYLPSLWEMLVKPGLRIHMVMWKETVPPKTDEPIDSWTCSPTANQIPTPTSKAQNPELLMDKQSEMLKFRDAVGRKYSFPWELVHTWDVSLAKNAPMAFSPDTLLLLLTS